MFNGIVYRWQINGLLRERRRLNRLYTKLYSKAKSKSDKQEFDQIAAEHMMEDDLITDQIYNLRSNYLTAKASQTLTPFPEFHLKGPDWEQSKISGQYRLTQKATIELLTAIRKERKERFDEWSRWALLAFGFCGMIIGILSLITKFLP